jgi:hypothetical protein
MTKVAIRIAVMLAVLISALGMFSIPASADTVCVWVRGYVGDVPINVPPASCGPPCSPGVGLTQPGRVQHEDVLLITYWVCANP